MIKWKRAIGVMLCTFMIINVCTVQAIAYGKVDKLYSDTTWDMQLAVGSHYRFLVTPEDANARIGYTVGNGKVLSTYVPTQSIKNKNGTQTYCFAFKCLSEGETGIYITVNNKPTRLFNVKVDNMTTMKQSIGSNAAKFLKIQIFTKGKCKTITDQLVIGNLLKDISSIQLKKLQNDPQMDGSTYTIKFYPSNSNGTFTFSDGGSGNFSKEKSCTFPISVGWYQINKGSSYDTWMKAMNYYFNSASGIVSRVK